MTELEKLSKIDWSFVEYEKWKNIGALAQLDIFQAILRAVTGKNIRPSLAGTFKEYIATRGASAVQLDIEKITDGKYVKEQKVVVDDELRMFRDPFRLIEVAIHEGRHVNQSAGCLSYLEKATAAEIKFFQTGRILHDEQALLNEKEAEGVFFIDFLLTALKNGEVKDGKRFFHELRASEQDAFYQTALTMLEAEPNFHDNADYYENMREQALRLANICSLNRNVKIINDKKSFFIDAVDYLNDKNLLSEQSGLSMLGTVFSGKEPRIIQQMSDLSKHIAVVCDSNIKRLKGRDARTVAEVEKTSEKYSEKSEIEEAYRLPPEIQKRAELLTNTKTNTRKM